MELRCGFKILPIINFSWYFPIYLLWLIWQITLSSFALVKIVWQIKPAISGSIVAVEIGKRTDFSLALLANSITLTPGTVSIFQQEKLLYVHSLTSQNAADLLEGTIQKKTLAAAK